MGKSRKAVAATSGSDPREMKPAAAAKRTAAVAGLREAASIAKRPATATIANRPAAAAIAKRLRCACGSLYLEDWIARNLDNEEAACEHRRTNFCMNVYSRARDFAIRAGMADEDAKSFRIDVRTRAGILWDLVHSRG